MFITISDLWLWVLEREGPLACYCASPGLSLLKPESNTYLLVSEVHEAEVKCYVGVGGTMPKKGRNRVEHWRKGEQANTSAAYT